MTPDIHTLSGAYVLDAVNDLEGAAFNRHLAECESCGVEVAELRATAARLADGAWSVAPPRLRDNVLREVARTRQLPPATRTRPGQPTAPTAWRRRLVAVAAAVVLAAGTATAAWVIQDHRVPDQSGEIAALQAQDAQVRAILGASDAKLNRSSARGGGQLTVIYSANQGKAVAMVTGLAKPASNQAYQLWILRGKTVTSAGVLDPGAGSGTRPVVLAGGERVAVTLEPATGSAQPTGAVLANVAVA